MNLHELIRTDTKQKDGSVGLAIVITLLSGSLIWPTFRLVITSSFDTPSAVAVIPLLCLAVIILAWASFSGLLVIFSVLFQGDSKTPNRIFVLLTIPALRRILWGSAGAALLASSLATPAFASDQSDVVWGWQGPTLSVSTAQSAKTPSASLSQIREQAKELERAVAVSPTKPNQTKEKTYITVKSGDSLWKISADQLGPHASNAEIAAFWPQIYETNRSVIGSDPNLIYAGQTLEIPERN